MTPADVVGTAGVTLLLLAFALQLTGRLSRRSVPYAALNLLGASLACWAATQIPFVPFVVLEGTWAIVAGAALVRAVRSGPPAGGPTTDAAADRSR